MEINGIGFENFRIFKDYSMFEFAPVTVLTGANSSGKTTIIKALKLMQNFWSQSDLGQHLNFEKGNHQLGDFKMCCSKNGKENEIKVTYQVNHILFDSPLTVELFFQLDESKSLNDVSLKNGILERMQIKLNKHIICNFKIKGNAFGNGLNYKYIIQSLLPKMKETYLNLQTEYKKYTEEANKYAHRGDWFTFVGDDCLKEANINQDRYYQLQDLFFFDFSKKYPDASAESENIIGNYNKQPFLYNLKTLDLFSKVQKTESAFFIDTFWKHLIHQHPEIENKFNYSTFKKFIEHEEERGNLHINLWKEVFLLSGKDNFEVFLESQMNLAIDEISKNTVVSNPISIDSIEMVGVSRFYKTFGIKHQATCAITGKTTYSSLFLWSPHYYLFKDTQNEELTESQKAIINCQEIFSDAIFLEKQILNVEHDFQIDKVLDKLTTFFINICKEIESSSKQMYFIDSIRAYSQRFYAYDSQVSNFNSFITVFLKNSYTETEESFLKKWLQEFEIADTCNIQLIEGAGSQIFLEKDKDKINLVDLGYGVTQFLPILLKIIYCNNIGMKTIVIEEPETNLHPKFQSKLADLFMDAYKTFKIRFIIETHSEYLIRKLQYLTANPQNNINPDDTLLYYIGNPNPSKREHGEKQIIKIKIEKNGQLSHPFGSGFFDEADNLAMLLMDYSFN